MIKNILVFTLGFIAGGFCTAKYLEHCLAEEQAYAEEVPEPKEEKMEETPEEQRVNIRKAEEDMKQYKEKTVNYASMSVKEPLEEEEYEGITVIKSDEFGEDLDYDEIELVYYADGVIADTDLDEILEVEELIGDSLKDFGKYEEDILHVRNDKRKAYYEITGDVRTYEEVIEDYRP